MTLRKMTLMYKKKNLFLYVLGCIKMCVLDCCYVSSGVQVWEQEERLQPTQEKVELTGAKGTTRKNTYHNKRSQPNPTPSRLPHFHHQITSIANLLILHIIVSLLNFYFFFLFAERKTILHILVSTSNRAPEKLYEGGLQQDLFLPFIATLKERCVVHEIGSSTDYRKLTLNQQGFYYIGQDLSTFLKEKFQDLIGQEKVVPQEVEVVMGRKLQVPLGADGCAYFPCDRPLGAADYFGYVPIFGLHNRTVAYQFVTLVDNKAKLLCTAGGSPLQLFEKIVTIVDAQFVAPRTSSQKNIWGKNVQKILRKHLLIELWREYD
ncbi:hypothetical protein UlMin_015921 [Ulmus minor]